jgi:hypothetical protein
MLPFALDRGKTFAVHNRQAGVFREARVSFRQEAAEEPASFCTAHDISVSAILAQTYPDLLRLHEISTPENE